MNTYSLLQSARWRLAGYPGASYRDLLRQSETWTRQELETYRNAKLRSLISHCYENVPYYRQAMKLRKITPEQIQTVQDLAKFPILTKRDVRTHSREMLANNLSTMKVSWAKTGGTTGEPMRIARNIDCVAMAAACYNRGLLWGGLTPSASRIKLFGGSLGLDHERITRKIGAFLRGELLLPAFELRTDTFPRFLQKIRGSKSRFVIGYASAILRLARLTEEANETLEFDAAFPTAELMLPEWEEGIRRVFKCKILPYYGCGEVHSLGFSKPDSGDYFIPEEHSLIEIVHDNSTQLYGEGRFLITDLDNYAMPIIRYLNGDAGTVSPASNNQPFSRIQLLHGRYNSLLMTDSGDLISGVIGTHIFRNTTTVSRYQIVQEEPLRVNIRIVPKCELSEDDRLLILRLFSRYLGNGMKIGIETVLDLPSAPSGKSVFVINRWLENSLGPDQTNAAF